MDPGVGLEWNQPTQGQVYLGVVHFLSLPGLTALLLLFLFFPLLSRTPFPLFLFSSEDFEVVREVDEGREGGEVLLVERGDRERVWSVDQ